MFTFTLKMEGEINRNFTSSSLHFIFEKGEHELKGETKVKQEKTEKRVYFSFLSKFSPSFTGCI